MAAIIIENLSNKKGGKPTYTDLRLDLKLNYTYDPRLESKDIIKDIEASYDIEAITNSLQFLFTTIPGQKILNPVYGLNLLQFLFTGITEDNARAMGEIIYRGILKYEPRVDVKKVYVFPDPENQTYEIGLKLDVPTLNIEGLPLKGVLSESGFYLK
jgi:phage baseplate assembly protein W